MNNNFSQTHVLKLKVHIKKLYLKVRFPCSVSFQLKHQLNFIQTRSTYALTDNIANVNDSIQMQIEADYNSQNNRYQSKKLSLVVYMTSSNGKVIAGSVKFDPLEKSIGMTSQCSVPLDKCPDKNAKIYFTHSCQFLSQNHRKFEKSSYSYIYELKHLSPRTNFSKNFIDSPPKTTILDYKKKPTDRSDHSRNHRSPGLTSNNYNNIRSYGTLSQRYHANLQPQTQLKHSQIQSEVVYKNKNHTEVSPNTKHNYPRLHEMSKLYQVNGLKMHENNSKSYNNNEPKNLNQSGRDKKNVERLKAQINFRHKEEVNTYENRIQAYKAQVEALSLEIENYKAKIRECDKKEKNFQMIIKELRQQIDKRKSKESTLNGRTSQLESLLLSKDKEIKGILSDKKLNQEEVQKQRLKYRTEERKQEIKINSLMQQLTKLDQKYKESQKSRIQSTADYNKLLNQLQENQKKQHGNIRDKDKLANEQKSKLHKKIQSLNHVISQLNHKIQQLQLNIQDVQNEKKSMSKQMNGKDLNIIGLENAKQQLTIQLCKQAEQMHAYEKEIQVLKLVEQERNSLKKKLIQYQHQFNTLKEKNTKSQSILNSLTLKISSLQQKVKQQSNQKSTLSSSESHLKRQLQKHQQITKKLLKQNQSLQTDILQLHKLNSQYKLKLQSANRYAQELRVEFDQKITIVLKDKTMVQSDLSEYKWALDKEKQHMDNLSVRYSALNQDILLLNQQLIDKSQKIKKLQQLLSQQRISSECIKNQKSTLTAKLKEFSSTIKSKDQEIYQLKKKLHQLDQQLYLAKDKLTHLQHSHKQKDQRENKKHKEKQQIIDSKLSELQKAQLSINQLRDQLTTYKQEISLNRKQVQHWKFIYDQLHGQNQSTEHKLILLKQQKSILQDKLSQLENHLKNKDQQLHKLERTILKLTQDSQQYKTHITESLENLLHQMSKQQQTQSPVITSITLKGLIDTKISKLQIEIIQKRNALLLKHNQQLFQLQQIADLAKLQLEKHKQLLQTANQQKDQLILTHKEKLKHYESLLKNQEEHYSHELNALQQKLYQKLSDNQKLHIQIKKLSEFTQQQNVQIHILITQYESAKQQHIHQINKIHQLKNDQLKERSLSDSKFNQISTHFEEIITSLRNQLFDKEKQFADLQSKLQDKLQQFKKLQHLFNNQKFQKDKLYQLLHQSQQKHQNLTIVNESITKRLKQQEKKSTKLLNQINELNEKLQSLQVKKQDLQYKNTKMDQQLMEVHVDNEKLKIQLQNCKEKNYQLMTAIKQKGQTDKTQLAKYLQQIKSLRDHLIKSKSQTDLKTFIIKQHQQTITLIKKQVQSLNYFISKKKQELSDQSQTIDTYKSTLEDSYEKINRIQNQKNQLEMKLLVKSNAIQNMNNVLNKKHLLQEELQKRSRDLIKIKDQKSLVISQKQREVQRLKSQLKSLKNECQKIKLNEDQLKKKNRQLQYLLQSNNLDLFQQKRRWASSNQREKQQIYKRIQTIEASKDTLQQQYRFEKQQMQKEIESLTLQYNQIVDKIKFLYEQKKQLQSSLDNLSLKNDQLKHSINKLNKITNSQKDQLTQCQKELKKLKQKLEENQSQKQSILKKHSKLIDNLKLNLNFQKEKAYLTFNTEESRTKLQSIFNKIDQSLKDSDKDKLRN